MSEGILLASVTRGTLQPEAERVARLLEAAPQIVAATEGETDAVALYATLACLLWEALPQSSWCGFYRRVEDRMLAVGPYQGALGCLRIALDRGVCGAAARTGETQRVDDVSSFPGHIACDDATRSELVVPVFGPRRVEAVLDLDSRSLSAFSAREARELERLLGQVFGPATRW